MGNRMRSAGKTWQGQMSPASQKMREHVGRGIQAGREAIRRKQSSGSLRRLSSGKIHNAIQNARLAMRNAGVRTDTLEAAIQNMQNTNMTGPGAVQRTLSNLGVAPEKIEAAAAATRENDRRSGLTATHGVAAPTRPPHNDSPPLHGESIGEKINFQPNMSVHVSINGEHAEVGTATTSRGEGATPAKTLEEDASASASAAAATAHPQPEPAPRQSSRPPQEQSAPARESAAPSLVQQPRPRRAVDDERSSQDRQTWRSDAGEPGVGSMRGRVADAGEDGHHVGILVALGLLVVVLVLYCCEILPFSALLMTIVYAVLYFMYKILSHKTSSEVLAA